MRKIDVRCRAISPDLRTGGYRLLSNSETIEFIKAGWEPVKLSKPYNDKVFSLSFDGRYSIADLTNDVCQRFGIVGGIRLNLMFRVNETTLISFEDEKTSLQDVIDRFNLRNVDAYLLCVFGLGEIFRKNGFKFYVPSHEGNRHHKPHIHVKTKDGREGSIDILTLELLAGDIKPREHRKIKRMLEGLREELLQAWTFKSDGMNVDIDYMLGLSKITK